MPLFAALTPFWIFSAFLLLLLVSLSVPIIKTIYIFKLVADITVSVLSSSASATAVFGVWGYCTDGISVSVLGEHDTTAGECSKTHLGYDINPIIGDLLQSQGYNPSLVSKGVIAVLVLHPIACGLCFLALLTSLVMLRPTRISRGASICTLLVGLLATVVTTAVFLIDVIVVAVVRHKIKNETDGDVTLNWGNAVWMTLGATIAMWLALVGACAGICEFGGRYTRRSRKAGTY